MSPSNPSDESDESDDTATAGEAGSAAGGLGDEADVERVALAEAAASAARSVAGVVRLQPGVMGLLKQLAAQAWERATGRPVPDVAGIDVDLHADGTVQVDARIVTAADHCAADVGTAVHTAITAALGPLTDQLTRVRVRIVEIDLEPQR